ncbi:MAG: ATP-dependent helicase/nuclease subunit A [Firmicutes bacterium ADurb.Bin456]|nr:MAG: ATP-dependent helicase/nuclease subunit A [Firmicutes bacterium ADurb.Bin456]
MINKKKGYASEILGQPLNWDQFAAVEKQYIDAEETRLLYVAATRAKNLLVISAYPHKPEISPWKFSEKHLKGVPALEEVQVSPASAIVGGVTITKQELIKARDGFLGPGSPVNAPGYSVASVTDLLQGGVASPARKSTGRGQSWGRVIHRVLESSIKKVPANMELFIENIIAEEGREPEEKVQVLSQIKKIMQSTIWQRMLKSKKQFVEVPFSMKVEGGKQGFKVDTVISGVIDLVFLENGGWVIVDYKTDTVEDEEGLKNLVKYYRPQVEMYRRFWEDISREKVCDAGLYFTHVDKWVGV